MFADWELCEKETASSMNTSTGIVPLAPWRGVSVRALAGFRLMVTFVDGVEGEVDMSALVHDPKAGVFRELADAEAFSEAFVLDGAVTWPTGQDLAPDAIHDEIAQHGRCIPR
jgi:hypothetical protein